MSDQFGRHKSTRWVRASVPSYGDEWGDDYDYEYESQEETESKNEPKDEEAQSGDNEIENYMDDQEGRKEQERFQSAQPLKNPNNLVLSIDRFQEDDSDSDDLTSDEESPSISNAYDLSNQQNSTEESFDFGSNQQSIQNFQNSLNGVDVGQPIKQSVSASIKEGKFLPPTPTYNTNQFAAPETPLSDRSYQSDADSIQLEPAKLNVLDISRHEEGLKIDNISESNHDIDEKEEIHENIEEFEDDADEKATLTDLNYPERNHAESESVGDDSDEVANYYDYDEADDSANFDNGEGLNYTKPDQVAPAQRKPVRTDALDSLINDLQYASINYDTTDEDIDFKGYDQSNQYQFEDENKEDDSSNAASSPISKSSSFRNDTEYVDSPAAILSSQERAKHESFISELGGHKVSIRKPPPSRDNLVSIDYSNIADAVSGYLSDQNSSTARTLDSQDAKSGENMSSVGSTLEDRETSELYPTVSTGSLSTGKISLAPTNAPSQTDDESIADTFRYDVSRRTSAMSTSTLGVGSWHPNNFRDQFINENDNESNYNFNPYADNTNYNKFTKLRTVTEAPDLVSNASSLSVPETIDAALPSIIEDPDDLNALDSNFKNDRVEDSMTSGNKAEFLNNDNSYSESISSGDRTSTSGTLDKEKRVGSQKFSSLLPPLEDEEKTKVIKQRNISNSSATSQDTKVAGDTSFSSDISSQPKKVYRQSNYPVFNWKQIMSTSQPVDRIRLLKEALVKETEYDTGLNNWLTETLKSAESSSNIHIGKIATQAYQNAPRNDIRRHGSLRTRVSIVKDKVETSGLQASSIGKRFLSRGKKFMKSAGGSE